MLEWKINLSDSYYCNVFENEYILLKPYRLYKKDTCFTLSLSDIESD